MHESKFAVVTGTSSGIGFQLARQFAQRGFDLVDRKQGRVLFTSSIAATMPGTFNAVYNGSKAFTQSFARAIRNELKDTGVTIAALMPGASETNFFERAGMQDTKIGAEEKDAPADVAREGLEALMTLAEMHRKKAEPGSVNTANGSDEAKQ